MKRADRDYWIARLQELADSDKLTSFERTAVMNAIRFMQDAP